MASDKSKEVFAANLRRLMLERGYNRQDLSNRINVKYTTLNDWYNAVTYPRMDKIQKLADTFGVDKSDLIEDRTTRSADQLVKSLPMTGKFRVVDVYDRLSCGLGTWIDEQPENFLAIPDNLAKRDVQYFSNQAEGDSMEPGIHSGDYLIFEQADEIPSGKIGSFSLNGQYYCKRFKTYADGSCWLLSDNSDYAPIQIRPEDEFRPIGLYRFKLSKEQ